MIAWMKVYLVVFYRCRPKNIDVDTQQKLLSPRKSGRFCSDKHHRGIFSATHCD